MWGRDLKKESLIRLVFSNVVERESTWSQRGEMLRDITSNL